MSSSESDVLSSTSSSKKRAATDDILDNLTVTGRQKKAKLSDALQEYRTAGRKAVAVLNPFGNASLAFHHGMRLDKADASNSSNISNEQERRYLAFYNSILDFIPGFRAALDELSYDELKPYITAINSSMSSQRSDDFSSLKYSMLEYILVNRSTDTLQPPIPKSSCKSNRGVNHPQLARELCPRKWLDEFDKDPDLGMQRLQDGTWPLLATNWPSFLYQAGAPYDVEGPNVSLFRGHAGVRAFQYLYLGPAAARSKENDDDANKHGGGKSKSSMYGVTKVTPQSWAWAMCVPPGCLRSLRRHHCHCRHLQNSRHPRKAPFLRVWLSVHNQTQHRPFLRNLCRLLPKQLLCDRSLSQNPNPNLQSPSHNPPVDLRVSLLAVPE